MGKPSLHRPGLRLLCFALGLVLLCAGCVDVILSNTVIRRTRYSFTSDRINSELVVVQLSDLHLASFGRDNRRLLRAVEQAHPDIIVMTGDIISQNSRDCEAVFPLVQSLLKLAPLYYAMGNHEQERRWYIKDDYLSRLTHAGVQVVERRYVDLELEGSALRLGGLCDYHDNGLGYDVDISEASGRYLDEFCDTEAFRLLLAHQPEGMLGFGLKGRTIELTLSGHTHGGQLRLPLIGALYAPEQGIFPKYSRGLFTVDGNALVISAGLGASGKLPRFHNLPEMVIITLKPQSIKGE